MLVILFIVAICMVGCAPPQTFDQMAAPIMSQYKANTIKLTSLCGEICGEGSEITSNALETKD